MKFRFTLVLLTIAVVLTLAGCSASGSPSGVVRRFYDYAGKGQYDKAAALFSQQAVQQYGIGKLESIIQTQASMLESQGGVKSFKIIKETIIKDQALVEAELTMGDGSVQQQRAELVKEGNDWRLKASK